MKDKKTTTKLKIGFCKLGLKTYFNTEKNSPQGSNHELVSIFEIFKNKGHECVMISNSDIETYSGNINDLDYLFVFNGFAPKTLVSNMCMFQQPINMMKTINKFKGPWVYFWTDPRYNPDNLPITNKNRIILSQENKYYGHLDKIILYNKQIRPLTEKFTNFRVLMNYTSTKRAKNALEVVKLLDGKIYGDWKKKTNEYVYGPIEFNLLPNVLDDLKYSWNQTVDPNWINQKFWEMILSNVICFHYESDLNNLVIPYFLRVSSIEDTSNMIKLADDDYNNFLETQKQLVLPEYLNGDFLYKVITSKL